MESDRNENVVHTVDLRGRKSHHCDRLRPCVWTVIHSNSSQQSIRSRQQVGDILIALDLCDTVVFWSAQSSPISRIPSTSGTTPYHQTHITSRIRPTLSFVQNSLPTPLVQRFPGLSWRSAEEDAVDAHNNCGQKGLNHAFQSLLSYCHKEKSLQCNTRHDPERGVKVRAGIMRDTCCRVNGSTTANEHVPVSACSLLSSTVFAAEYPELGGW